MERNNRLPNVIFLSSKALEMIESQTTEDVVCLENEANGISIKNVSFVMPTRMKQQNIATLFNCGTQPERNRIA